MLQQQESLVEAEKLGHLSTEQPRLHCNDTSPTKENQRNPVQATGPSVVNESSAPSITLETTQYMTVDDSIPATIIIPPQSMTGLVAREKKYNAAQPQQKTADFSKSMRRDASDTSSNVAPDSDIQMITSASSAAHTSGLRGVFWFTIGESMLENTIWTLLPSKEGLNDDRIKDLFAVKPTTPREAQPTNDDGPSKPREPTIFNADEYQKMSMKRVACRRSINSRTKFKIG